MNLYQTNSNHLNPRKISKLPLCYPWKVNSFVTTLVLSTATPFHSPQQPPIGLPPLFFFYPTHTLTVRVVTSWYALQLLKKKEHYRMAQSECVRDNLSMPWFSWVSSSASCCCKDVNCRFRWPQKSWCCFSRAAYCCWLLAVISVTTSALSVIRLAWSQMWKSSQNRWCTCIYY